MSVVSPALTLLLAPTGQLSGDGQLRELMAERRSHTGGDAALWFLPPSLLQERAAALPPGPSLTALV
jgi:hypothetical protein